MKRKELIEKTVQAAVFGAVLLNSGCGGGNKDSGNSQKLRTEDMDKLQPITMDEMFLWHDEYLKIHPEQNTDEKHNPYQFYEFLKSKKGLK